jgi:hypothetical protein
MYRAPTGKGEGRGMAAEERVGVYNAVANP